MSDFPIENHARVRRAKSKGRITLGALLGLAVLAVTLFVWMLAYLNAAFLGREAPDLTALTAVFSMLENLILAVTIWLILDVRDAWKGRAETPRDNANPSRGDT